MEGPKQQPDLEIGQEKINQVGIEIYHSSEAIKQALLKIVGLFEWPPAAIIDIEYSDKSKYRNKGDNYEELRELIQSKINEGVSVVLTDSGSLEFHARDKLFYSLFINKRVGFINIFNFVKEGRELINKLSQAPNIQDKLALKIGSLGIRESSINWLRHDLSPGHSREANKKAMLAINKIYGKNFNTETDTKLAYDFIFKYKPEFRDEFEGKELDGVFCDAEGTLIDTKTGKINPRVLKKLDEYDKETFVRIWTGGNVKDVQRVVAEAGRSWLVLSKYDFHGSKPKIVIDDLSLEDFKKEFSIEPTEFINIREKDLDENKY